MEWEEIFANNAAEKRLKWKIDKQVIQLKIKKNNQIKKWVEGLNWHLQRRHTDGNRHMKRCSISLIIREMQIKTIMRFTPHLSERLSSKSLQIGKDLQDSRGEKRGDHLPPHKYIKNTSTCETTPTEHLLNTGRRPQTSQKARNSARTWLCGWQSLGAPARCQARASEVGELSSGHWTPETSQPQVISIGESSPRDLHLNTKTQLNSTMSKLQSPTPHAKQLATQEHKPTH